MANEKIISPGAFTRENDQTFLQKGIEQIGAVLIGPTVKGTALVPTIVTSYSEYVSKFGTTFKSGSDYYQYFTSYTAREYFNNGGKALTVVRIMSGSYSPATSNIQTTGSLVSGSSTTYAFQLETLSHGVIMNNSGSEVSGSLVSGSVDNVRWEIVSNNINTGTFNLLIRRGDDNNKSKVILETWTNLSLDPKSPNYIAAVIGDTAYSLNASENYIQTTGSYPNKSQYVRVSSVNSQTPDYFDNNGNYKSQYTASLPAPGSGSFDGGSDGFILGNAKFYDQVTDGATNSQGYTAEAYTNALNLLSNQDEYDFNLILLPGIIANNNSLSSVVDSAIQLAENRGDAFVIIDPVGYGSALTTATGVTPSYNSNYAGAYWPWVQIRDSELNKNVWVPASTVLGGVFAFSDQVAAEWWAPAGLNRGGIPSVVRAERKLSQTNRDDLYLNNINPIASFPGEGVVAWGQKTLQKRSSALDRINVRRLLIAIKKYVASTSRYLVFEQNTNATRNRFLSIVNPYLESIVQRQGLYAFKVVMDDSNNTPDVIDRNQLVGQIYIQPTKTAEFIVLDFNVVPTGATFPE